MMSRVQAWAWWFKRNPNVVASWGHQNGRWPQHLATCVDYPDADGEYPDRSEERPCITSCACWCHDPDEHPFEGGHRPARAHLAYVPDDGDPRCNSSECWCHQPLAFEQRLPTIEDLRAGGVMGLDAEADLQFRAAADDH